MKKLLIISAIVLTACQAPSNYLVEQPTAPRVCMEYNNAFVCKAPVRQYREEFYPKNNSQMRSYYGSYQEGNSGSLSQTVYGN